MICAFIKSMTAAAIVLAGLSGAAQDATQPAVPSKPNIIFILADDLGYGDVQCNFPGGKIPTPNLDKLAAQGMRFTDAHAPTSVCTPTRYSILTGQYAWRTRLKTGVLWQWDKPLIDEGRLTLPAMLREKGYRTAALGKWHLGMNWPFSSAEAKDRLAKNMGNLATPDDIDWTKPITGGPTDRGFDTYFGVNAPNFSPYAFIENDHIAGPAPTLRFENAVSGRLNQHPGPMQAGFDRKNIAPTLARKAVEMIDKSANMTNPLFLYLALTGPHSPIIPNDEFKGKSGIGDYGDWVMEMDWTVGEVMKALERGSLAKNTLVIFTSDNGPEYWNYEEAKNAKHYAMGDLRGVKRDTWEGGHRVPFIATWPGTIKAGSVSEETICHVDTMATCAEITGYALPNEAAEDSVSFLAVLLGKKLSSPLREATVHHGGNGELAIRKGNWVYIDARTGEVSKEPEWIKKERGYVRHTFPGELYDLSQDLAERKNLCGEHPEIVRELKALLDKYEKEGRSVPVRRTVKMAGK